ncbi:hypothetical protein [Candidatus Vondammii sp. HM_W22]|uniref:hypothetical protein n=1 Tax=Candidatus Vondammii sp. HM_W22 TaxID=2687299 RepID=UPI001F141B26|nr:hypothetical protein [Candidatus Vondammii sp. HM_W22]
MKTDISKLCADFLRTSYASKTGAKLKATHTRELIAAFFGYKSHAALISEKSYPLDNLEEAAILVPDIPLLTRRQARLKELPDDLPQSQELASLISTFLSDKGYFGGNVWIYDTLEAYITEVLLIECDNFISDELSGVMAETNAGFEDSPYYENAKIVDTGDDLEIIASGTLKGTQIGDKMFSGDRIDFGVRVTLPRIAGKRSFLDFEIEAGGAVNDDWRDKESVHSTYKQSALADELGLTDFELEQLSWEMDTVESNDGLVYAYLVTFTDGPAEILQKISLDDFNTIRVSANAFDQKEPEEVLL